MLKSPIAEFDRGYGTREDAFDTWLNLVKTFSALDITNELDRVPAVIGIATHLYKILKTPFIEGLWRDDLARGLLWQKLSYQRSRRVMKTNSISMPTWTWASVELLSHKGFGLSYNSVLRRRFAADHNFHLISHRLGLRGEGSLILDEESTLEVNGA